MRRFGKAALVFCLGLVLYLIAANSGAGWLYVRRPRRSTPGGLRRRSASPAIARLGEIYLHARFRDAVPADLAEEFDRLEPEAFAAVERLKAAAIVRE
jgi:hypothetical protein